MATTPMNTEEKELIYEASMSKIDVLSDKLIKKDIEYFRDTIEDLYESRELDKEELSEIKRDFTNEKEFIKELSKQLKGNLT